MNDEEKKAIEDMRAFLDFALLHAEDVTFFSVLSTIGHDVNGLFNEDKLFLPRTHGYAERMAKDGHP